MSCPTALNTKTATPSTPSYSPLHKAPDAKLELPLAREPRPSSNYPADESSL